MSVCECRDRGVIDVKVDTQGRKEVVDLKFEKRVKGIAAVTPLGCSV